MFIALHMIYVKPFFLSLTCSTKAPKIYRLSYTIFCLCLAYLACYTCAFHSVFLFHNLRHQC